VAQFGEAVDKIKILVDSAVEIPQERLEKRLNEAAPSETGGTTQTAHGEKNIEHVEFSFLSEQCKSRHFKVKTKFKPSTTTRSPNEIHELIERVTFTRVLERKKLKHKVVVDLMALPVLETRE